MGNILMMGLETQMASAVLQASRLDAADYALINFHLGCLVDYYDNLLFTSSDRLTPPHYIAPELPPKTPQFRADK